MMAKLERAWRLALVRNQIDDRNPERGGAAARRGIVRGDDQGRGTKLGG